MESIAGGSVVTPGPIMSPGQEMCYFLSHDVFGLFKIFVDSFWFFAAPMTVLVLLIVYAVWRRSQSNIVLVVAQLSIALGLISFSANVIRAVLGVYSMEIARSSNVVSRAYVGWGYYLASVLHGAVLLIVSSMAFVLLLLCLRPDRRRDINS